MISLSYDDDGYHYQTKKLHANSPWYLVSGMGAEAVGMYLANYVSNL